MEEKMTLKKDRDVLILQRNGRACICPFQMPVPHQDGLGRPVMLNQTCNSTCAHFSFLLFDDLTGKAELTCGAKREYRVSIDPDKPKTTLIN